MCFIVQEEHLVITVKTTTSGGFGRARAFTGAARDEGKHGISRHTKRVRMEMNISSSVTVIGIFLELRSISPVTAEF